MKELRNEIIEAQKMRADLIKWKLLLVSGLGGAGLGLQGKEPRDLELLLCLIPFVCAYVDAAARHLNLRIQVIAHFLRSSTDDASAAYERLCKQVGEAGVFAIEAGVLRWSTIFLSLLVGVSGFFFRPKPETDPVGILQHSPLCLMFMLSGVFGMVAAVVIEHLYKARVRRIEQCE